MTDQTPRTILEQLLDQIVDLSPSWTRTHKQDIDQALTQLEAYYKNWAKGCVPEEKKSQATANKAFYTTEEDDDWNDWRTETLRRRG